MSAESSIPPSWRCMSPAHSRMPWFLHDAAARRAVAVTLLGTTIRILSAEDLAVLKLLFFRGKDVVDVERVVAVQGARLDRVYVRRWLVDCVGEESERVRTWDRICAALPAS